VTVRPTKGAYQKTGPSCMQPLEDAPYALKERSCAWSPSGSTLRWDWCNMATWVMTRNRLVRKLAEACGTNNKVAKGVVDRLAHIAISEIEKSGVFVLPGVGRLVRVDRKARIGRNPATGEPIKIPAKHVVNFRALVAPTGRTTVSRDRIRAAVRK